MNLCIRRAITKAILEFTMSPLLKFSPSLATPAPRRTNNMGCKMFDRFSVDPFRAFVISDDGLMILRSKLSSSPNISERKGG